MDDLLADFIAETREMLEAIEGEVVAWEARPSDRARLDAIFRFVHTVKGNCGFFDFPRLEKLSHAAETTLAEVRAGHRQPTTHLVNGVLAVIDRIQELVDAIEAGRDMPDTGDERLIAALEPDSGDAPLPADPDGESEENGATAQRGAGPMRSIRLPVDLLDSLMSGVSDMVLARNDLARRLREAGTQPTIDGPFERLSSILDDVREGVTKMRMQRIDHLYHSLPRLVRDLSAELGKQVMLDLQGSDVELDREMIESVRDPITHIIRNAIDHGIETPSARLAKGKREIGLLSISARQAGNQIRLVIGDDGSGLNVDRICAKAVETGVSTQDELDAMTREAKLELIFEPGLSTADAVSDISGRGVGMDVVRANLEKVGGSINVDSLDGEGSRFVLQLPLTLSIVACLTVGVGAARYAIPRPLIEEIARGSSQSIEVHDLGDSSFVTFRGKRVPCIALADVLGLENEPGSIERGVLVFVRLTGGDCVAIGVDRVFDNEDLVVKPLAPAIMELGLYSGSTLLDDGNPILMLDIPNIAVREGLVEEDQRRRAPPVEQAHTDTQSAVKVIVFAGLDGKRRAVRMNAVDRIQSIERAATSSEGHNVYATIDGAILPVAGIGDCLPDRERLTVLRLNDGTRDILFAIDSIEDAADLSGEIVPLEGRPDLEGSILSDGRSAGLLDVHALFSRYGSSVKSDLRKVCRLPADNDWSHTFLAPLVKAAGYGIVSKDADQADIVFVLDEESDLKREGSPPIIRLRSNPDAASDAQGSIYRYDREGLLAALRATAGGKS